MVRIRTVWKTHNAYNMYSVSLTLYLMPLSVTELESVIRLENCRNWSSAVVNRESHGSIHHLQDHIIPSTLDGHQDTGNVARFDVHGDVKVQTNL